MDIYTFRTTYLYPVGIGYLYLSIAQNRGLHCLGYFHRDKSFYGFFPGGLWLALLFPVFLEPIAES